MSRLIGKPTICIYKTKGVDLLRSNCDADERLCFRYLYFLNQAIFCDCTGWFVSDLFENHIFGFPTRRLIYKREK